MNWIINKLKNLQTFFGGDCCEPAETIAATETTTAVPVETPTAPEPEIDYAKMSMAELRGHAAERNLGDGRYKGVNRRQLTKLIKEN